MSRYERDDQLVPLLDNGWNMVDGRDAVHKTFIFQSFNEVSIWFKFGVALLPNIVLVLYVVIVQQFLS